MVAVLRGVRNERRLEAVLYVILNVVIVLDGRERETATATRSEGSWITGSMSVYRASHQSGLAEVGSGNGYSCFAPIWTRGGFGVRRRAYFHLWSRTSPCAAATDAFVCFSHLPRAGLRLLPARGSSQPLVVAAIMCVTSMQ